MPNRTRPTKSTTSISAHGGRLGGDAVRRRLALLAPGLLLRARPRVDDRRQLALELGAKRLHSRRETEAVAEVLELLVELKPRPRRADLHPPSGRHRVAGVEEVVVEDARPRARALVGLVARPLELLAAAGVERDVVPHADAAVAARAPGRLGEVPAAAALAVQHEPRAVAAEADVLGERQLLLQRGKRAGALEAEDAVLGGDVVRAGRQRRVRGVR